METLRFLVKGQMIKKDPGCPFNKMVAGSSNYYIAEFDMDETWNGYSCVAYYSLSIEDYKVVVSEWPIT